MKSIFHSGLIGLISITFILASAPVAAEQLRVLVLDTELIDEMKQNPNSPDKPANLARIDRVGEQLRHGLDASDFYEVIDLDVVRDRVDGYLAYQRHIRNCSGCIIELGRAAEADLVFVSWVQIVSSLILNQNLVAYDMHSGEEVMTAFTDFRSNSDNAWFTATRYLLERFYSKYHDGNMPDGLRDYRPADLQ